MKTIEGECCRDCLVLARCKSKSHYQLIDSCLTIRRQLYKFAKDEVDKNGPTHVKFTILNVKFHVQPGSEKDKYLVS
jgi:hypothetical protein